MEFLATHVWCQAARHYYMCATHASTCLPLPDSVLCASGGHLQRMSETCLAIIVHQCCTRVYQRPCVAHSLTRPDLCLFLGKPSLDDISIGFFAFSAGACLQAKRSIYAIRITQIASEPTHKICLYPCGIEPSAATTMHCLSGAGMQSMPSPIVAHLSLYCNGSAWTLPKSSLYMRARTDTSLARFGAGPRAIFDWEI